MRDGDGWQLLPRLQEHLLHPIYAVAMSTSATAADQIRSQAAGYRGHLSKPFSLHQLEGVLKVAVRAKSISQAGTC